MVYLVARGVSRVGDTIEDGAQAGQKSKFDKLVNFFPLEKIDLTLNEYLEKILRKIKLVFMKWDNIVTGYLDKIKKTNGNGKNGGAEKPNLFFKDLTKEKKPQHNKIKKT